jgi:hypothetical protein
MFRLLSSKQKDWVRSKRADTKTSLVELFAGYDIPDFAETPKRVINPVPYEHRVETVSWCLSCAEACDLKVYCQEAVEEGLCEQCLIAKREDEQVPNE